MKSVPGLPFTPGRAAWKSLLPWLGVLLFLSVFFFYPLARILWVGLNPAALLGISSQFVAGYS